MIGLLDEDEYDEKNNKRYLKSNTMCLI